MKKFLAIVLALAMVLSMSACKKDDTDATKSSTGTQGTTSQAGNASGETYNYDITVWVPEAAVELTRTQIDAFNKTNTDGITLNATIEAVSEADAATQTIRKDTDI